MVRTGRCPAGNFQNEFAAYSAEKIFEAACGDVKGARATDHIVTEKFGKPVTFEERADPNRRAIHVKPE